MLMKTIRNVVKHSKSEARRLLTGGSEKSRSGSRAQVAAMLSVCTMYDHLD